MLGSAPSEKRSTVAGTSAKGKPRSSEGSSAWPPPSSARAVARKGAVVGASIRAAASASHAATFAFAMPPGSAARPAFQDWAAALAENCCAPAGSLFASDAAMASSRASAPRPASDSPAFSAWNAPRNGVVHSASICSSAGDDAASSA